MAEEQNIRDIIAGKTVEEALSALDRALEASPDDAVLLVERGKLRWRTGRRAEAISDYEKAAAIDPDGPARLLLEHTGDIMDFFNPDLLNP